MKKITRSEKQIPKQPSSLPSENDYELLLTKRFGRGFSVDNLESMRLFYLSYPETLISETLSRIFALKTS